MAGKSKRKGKGAAKQKSLGKAALKRQDLQQAILQAAAAAGEEFGSGGLVAYLRAQALAAPSPFLTLLGKTLAREDERGLPAVRLIELVPAVIKPEEPERE